MFSFVTHWYGLGAWGCCGGPGRLVRAPGSYSCLHCHGQGEHKQWCLPWTPTLETAPTVPPTPFDRCSVFAKWISFTCSLVALYHWSLLCPKVSKSVDRPLSDTLPTAGRGTGGGCPLCHYLSVSSARLCMAPLSFAVQKLFSQTAVPTKRNFSI